MVTLRTWITLMPSEKYSCTVCGYPDLSEPPVDEYGCATFSICPCCGIEFGYDDATTSHQDLRQRWLEAGAVWFSKQMPRPDDWNASAQLKAAGLIDSA